jgi:predicted enzyme related to lactoylglutathione lyase
MIVKEILNRIYVNDMEMALTFYENLLNQKCKSRFRYTEVNLELAQVGPFLIISGSEAALEPFKATSITLLVDSIYEFKKYLLDNNSEIIRDIKEVPTGMNMTVKHNDGTIVEYVEHKGIVNQNHSKNGRNI